MSNIQLSNNDTTELDDVKKEIKAQSRPETIRFLIREWRKNG